MASQEGKNKINIGSSSLILIFFVLCLTTFGLLSLISARNDWNLAQKNAAAVLRYYEADALGEEFIRMVDETLLEILSFSPSEEEFQRRVRETISEYYQENSNLITVKIPMANDQALNIELAVDPDHDIRYRIRAWTVINAVDYEIDDSMPVWDGWR